MVNFKLKWTILETIRWWWWWLLSFMTGWILTWLILDPLKDFTLVVCCIPLPLLWLDHEHIILPKSSTDILFDWPRIFFPGRLCQHLNVKIEIVVSSLIGTTTLIISCAACSLGFYRAQEFDIHKCACIPYICTHNIMIFRVEGYIRTLK